MEGLGIEPATKMKITFLCTFFVAVRAIKLPNGPATSKKLWQLSFVTLGNCLNLVRHEMNDLKKMYLFFLFFHIILSCDHKNQGNGKIISSFATLREPILPTFDIIN